MSFGSCLVTAWYPINQPINGPTYYSDSNPQNSFCVFFLKDRVYINRPQSILALKTNITNKINQIPKEMRENVMKNFQGDWRCALNATGVTWNTSLRRRMTKMTFLTYLIVTYIVVTESLLSFELFMHKLVVVLKTVFWPVLALTWVLTKIHHYRFNLAPIFIKL